MLTQGTPTFIAAELILAGARVKLAPGSGIRVVNAGINDAEIGTAILHSGKDQYAAESAVGVKLTSEPGSRTCIAAGAIAAGALIKRAAAGKVNDTGLGADVGVALEDAAADGDNIEALFFNPTAPVAVTLTGTAATDIAAIHAALVQKGIVVG